MNILEVATLPEGSLSVVAADGRSGVMDLQAYFKSPAFRPLADPAEFAKVRNGGYYVEWECGADLSADTIEAQWIPLPSASVGAHSPKLTCNIHPASPLPPLSSPSH